MIFPLSVTRGHTLREMGGRLYFVSCMAYGKAGRMNKQYA